MKCPTWEFIDGNYKEKFSQLVELDRGDKCLLEVSRADCRISISYKDKGIGKRWRVLSTYPNTKKSYKEACKEFKTLVDGVEWE